jgi:hypothetical protein
MSGFQMVTVGGKNSDGPPGRGNTRAAVTVTDHHRMKSLNFSESTVEIQILYHFRLFFGCNSETMIHSDHHPLKHMIGHRVIMNGIRVMSRTRTE